MCGNDTAIGPALHSRMALMTQLGCHRADATEAGDDLSGIHASNVQMTCTSVNMEYVRTDQLKADMTKDGITGAKLRALTDRAGLKGDALAKACGWKTRSGPQQFFSQDEPLSYTIAFKFAHAIVGKGNPPVQLEDLLGITKDGDLLLEWLGKAAPRPGLGLPSNAALEEILKAFVPALSAGQGSEASLRDVAQKIGVVLQIVAEQPDCAENLDRLRGVIVGVQAGIEHSSLDRSSSV